MKKYLHRLRRDPRAFGSMVAAAAVTTSLLVAWGVRPDTTTADDFAAKIGPPDLGTLIGQELSIRVTPGPYGPGYEVLDAAGTVVGKFESQYEMIAAFDVAAPSSQLADVPSYDPYD